MPTLTMTERGQVTFRKEVLQHLGVQPGEKVEYELLPSGQVSLRAAKPDGRIDAFVGMLANKTRKKATLSEIQSAIADGWSGKR